MNMEYQRWFTKLLGFEFDIVYKPCIENKAADSLSRVDHNTMFSSLLALTIPTSLQIQDILKEIESCKQINDIIHRLKEGKEVNVGYSMVDERLLYKHRLVIPATS